MLPHSFHPTILREYDIRGIVGETLFPADAYAIGRSLAVLATESGQKTAVVGRDGRLSSPELEAAVVAGLTDGGCAVKRIGCGPSPMLYYAATVSGAAVAVMVTGSHNPPDHNGFKMMRGAKPLFGADIRRIGAIAAAGFAAAVPGGSVSDWPVFAEYTDRLVQDWDGGDHPLTVVWDAGNGAAGEVMTALSARLPGRHSLLNADIDGTFPAHHPDPTDPATLTQLIAAVQGVGADLGIAFDGDGDRIGVVDGQGRILWGDQILQILAEDVLRDRPGAVIIADVKASQALFDEVRRMGGQPEMWKTGHSLIKTRLAETGAALAGEMSGHLFFADRWYGFDDALYAAVRFLGTVARLGEPLTDRVDRLPVWVNTPELRFACPDEQKFTVMEAVRTALQAEGAEMSLVDGVRVSTADGWWLLRASNTQAVLVARAESRDRAGLIRLIAALTATLEQAGVSPTGLQALVADLP